MAFTIEERQTLGIHGLLPAAVKTQDEQLELCRLNLERYTDDLSKYIYLTGLLVSINLFKYYIVRVAKFYAKLTKILYYDQYKKININRYRRFVSKNLFT